MPDIKGGCLCGKVTYSANVEPIFVGICHCTNCQKATGSAFGTVLAIPTSALTVTGTTSRFDGKGDSGSATHRDFCPVCGSTVAQSADLMAGVTMIPVGTLDDPSWVKPPMQIYCDSAMPWVSLGGEMKSFPKMPPPG